jgi:hypothetical protein
LPTQCTGRLPLWCDLCMLLEEESDCKQETMVMRVCERCQCNNHQFTRTRNWNIPFLLQNSLCQQDSKEKQRQEWVMV